MSRATHRITLLLILLTCVSPVSAQTESADAKTVDENAVFVKELSPYSISSGDQAGGIEFRPQPVFNWTNPVSQDQKGAIFVWMSAGRPQVIGCCFLNRPNGQESRIHELHTLAATELKVEFDGQQVWRPRQPFKLSPVPSAQPPVASAQGRLIQMRQIARRFTGQMTREDGDQTELRLISRPVLAYQPMTAECTDGAIFVLAAAGTDPDAFLVLENKIVNDQPTWHFGLLRFHYNGLKAQIDGEEIWRVEAKPRLQNNYHGSKTYQDDPYISFRTY